VVYGYFLELPIARVLSSCCFEYQKKTLGTRVMLGVLRIVRHGSQDFSVRKMGAFGVAMGILA